MQILDWTTLDERERGAALARPKLYARIEATRIAQQVIDAVRQDGDVALRSFTQRFDEVDLKSFTVSEAEITQARHALNPSQVAALERAIANVRAFHSAQLPKPFTLETEPGVRLEMIVQPIETVGLYVPAGSAPLPSTVIMLAVPAQLAGCAQRVLCTPPGANGNAHPAVLAAAHLCGIDRIFKVGGAQAIAALAYGTETVPKVDKIFGPGNAWVTAAKALVAQDPAGAACDLPAGPSEVLIIADETARADFVAADLLAQAEHDPLAQGLLVTERRELASCVKEVIECALPRLTRRRILEQSLANCRCILVADLNTALTLANDYAPEHLHLHVRDPRSYLAKVRNAGSVFLGPWSAEAFGDYCSGANHVLPTSGYARTFSGLSVRDFMKTITVQEISRSGMTTLGPTAAMLANLEGLTAHAQAVTCRLDALAEGRA